MAARRCGCRHTPARVAFGVHLTSDHAARHARHLSLAHVGAGGQARIGASRVLVVGAGGLGSPVLLYLAAAGVGRLTIVDDDRVSVSNLQRQVVHDTPSAGGLKVESAAARLRALNPDVEVTALATRLDADGARQLVPGFDVVVDGSDNFETRYALSDACVAAGVPNVYGSVQGWGGEATVLCAKAAPCYRCMHPVPPPAGSVPACSDTGVLGPIPGIVGAVQATEVLKLLAGAGSTLAGRLLLIDGLRMRLHEVALARNPHCAACGSGRGTLNMNEEGVAMAGHEDFTPAELRRRLDAGERLVLVDVREPSEWAIGHLDGARHIPLRDVPAALATLDPGEPMVVYCHHGMRSANAAAVLRQAGFAEVHNLAGGIDRWSIEVDPSIARY